MPETSSDPATNSDLPIDPGTAQLQAGHGEISATIALDAVLSTAPPLDVAEARLNASWPSGWRSAQAPALEAVPPDAFDDRLAELADQQVRPGEPVCRVLLATGKEPRIAVMGHHAVLDGLGLVAALSAILGEDLATSARGVDPAAIPLGRVTYGLRRLGEALLVPPTRIAPDRRGREPGDHLVKIEVPPMRADTATLVAAAAHAVREWNAGRGRASDRVVVAVGAARGGGRSPSMVPRAAWFRLRITTPEAEAVRRQLQTARPEPQWTSSVLVTPPGAWVARSLSRRTGSTLLVSNLGRLEPAGTIRAAAFYPMAHGRSGVALGCATAGAATVFTIRARRSGFSAAGAARLLTLIVGRVEDS